LQLERLRRELAVGLTYLERASVRAGEPELPADDWPRFGREARSAAAALWASRASQERCSAAVFATIVAGLARLPLPLPLLGALARIPCDELRHAALCGRLAGELGFPEPEDDLEGARRRLCPPGVAPTAAAISLLLVEGAVGETMSTALFAATRSATNEPRTRAALSLILRDEARHARTCWEAFSVIADRVPVDRLCLEADLSRELGIIEQQTILPALRRVEAGAIDPPELEALGVLPALRRAEVFYATLETKVLPRVSALGMDGPAAWARRYR